MIARRTKDEQFIPQAKLVSGNAPTLLASMAYLSQLAGFTDGSISTLTPVDEVAFKRLQLLQGQLTRSVQHTAGLNPKAHRQVVLYCLGLLDDTAL